MANNRTEKEVQKKIKLFLGFLKDGLGIAKASRKAKCESKIVKLAKEQNPEYFKKYIRVGGVNGSKFLLKDCERELSKERRCGKTKCEYNDQKIGTGCILRYEDFCECMKLTNSAIR